MSDLKPCPWELEVPHPLDIVAGEMCFWVECRECGAVGPNGYSPAEAIAAWDTRSICQWRKTMGEQREEEECGTCALMQYDYKGNPFCRVARREVMGVGGKWYYRVDANDPSCIAYRRREEK